MRADNLITWKNKQKLLLTETYQEHEAESGGHQEASKRSNYSVKDLLEKVLR